MKNLRETILSLWGRRESKDMLGTHLEEGLTEDLRTDVVGFINYEGPYRIKVAEGVFLEGERLKHSYDKVTICLLLILLNNAYCGTWTELLNAFSPLICEKLFVNYNHCAVAQLTRYCQGYGGLAIPAWERENTMARTNSCSKSLVLVGCVS